MSAAIINPKTLAILTYEYVPFPGGIATYAYGLVSALRADGLNPIVVAPHYPDLPQPEGRDPDTHRFFRHHRQSLPAMWKVFKLLRKTPRDTVILAADLRSIVLTYLLTRIVSRRYIAMVHGSEASKFRRSSPLFRLLKRAYLTADKVVYNSRATAAIFHAAIGTPSLDAVTYLGVENVWFGQEQIAFEHSALKGLGSEENVICSVGRIEPRKGQADAVRAIAIAQRDMGLKNCIYVVAGKIEDEAYANEIVRLGDELGVAVILTGRLSQSDLKGLYRRAACHSLLAKELEGKIEGFGLVLLEAGAQGCPTVATSVGGIPEVVDDAGTLIAPEDLNAAAKAFVSYVQDAPSRLEQGRRIRERAERFTWSACAAETFSFAPRSRSSSKEDYFLPKAEKADGPL